MSNNIITIGTALKWRGIYDRAKTYYQDNIVLEAGCIFRCKVQQAHGVSPTQLRENDGHFVFINQDIWDVILDMTPYYNKMADLKKYTSEVLECYNELNDILGNVNTLNASIQSIYDKLGDSDFDGQTLTSVIKLLQQQFNNLHNADIATQLRMDALTPVVLTQKEYDALAAAGAVKKRQHYAIIEDTEA